MQLHIKIKLHYLLYANAYKISKVLLSLIMRRDAKDKC